MKGRPSVVGGFGGDGVLSAFPLEDVGVVDAVGEVFCALVA
jgi:hypothetical protein